VLVQFQQSRKQHLSKKLKHFTNPGIHQRKYVTYHTPQYIICPVKTLLKFQIYNGINSNSEDNFIMAVVFYRTAMANTYSQDGVTQMNLLTFPTRG
jgi:hypothetical protein